MRIAFYAPLKSPDSPVPSGDRLIGQMLWQAIEAGGHELQLASRLCSFDKRGDRDRQKRIANIADWLVPRVLKRLQHPDHRPDLWLTYHLYHKSPDLIGPQVARALGIPYCVVEASVAPKQESGLWAAGYRQVAEALSGAALVLNINPKDEAGVRSAKGPKTRVVTLPPFIDGTKFRAARRLRAETRAELARTYSLDPSIPWLLAVGMMRNGDKAASYSMLARALALLADKAWQLVAVGEGPARGAIEAVFADAGARMHFVGQKSTDEIAALMGASDLLVWPAVNEAIGMVFIEAAMAGLPVVGADRPGIAAVVAHGTTGLLVPEHDAAAFAGAVTCLLNDKAMRLSMGEAGARCAAAQHDLQGAVALLCGELEASM